MARFDDRLVQSPVNILSDCTVQDPNQTFTLTFNTGITAIENLGHTIQLDFKEGSTAFARGKTYFPKQFHFRTPSEHLIDEMTFPMEMHIVNVLKDSTSGNQPRYMVITFLFRMGHENKFLKEFFNAIPHEEEKDTLPPGVVNFQDLLNTIPKNNDVSDPRFQTFEDRLSEGRHIQDKVDSDTSVIRLNDQVQLSLVGIDKNVYTYLSEAENIAYSNDNLAAPATPSPI